MKQIHLYIAMSLDGYIADARGSVDWLAGQSETEEEGGSYADFIRGIDPVLMGWNTYHQIVTELSPDEWPYQGLTTYVITHRDLPSTGHLRFTSADPVALVRQLQQEPGRDLWICGGARLIEPLLQADCIDRYTITVIPILLGEGIRLFGSLEQPRLLRLVETRHYNGMTDLVYVRR